MVAQVAHLRHELGQRLSEGHGAQLRGGQLRITIDQHEPAEPQGGRGNREEPRVDGRDLLLGEILAHHG